MEDRKDDIFILDFFEVTFLLIAAFIAAALLVGNPEKAINVLVPVVFGGVGLMFLVGKFVLSRKKEKDELA